MFKRDLVEAYKVVQESIVNLSGDMSPNLLEAVEKLGSLIQSLESPVSTAEDVQMPPEGTVVEDENQGQAGTEIHPQESVKPSVEAGTFEAEKRQRELEAVFNAMTDAVAFYDEKGNINRINPVGIAYYGFDPQQRDYADVDARMQLVYPDGSRIVREEYPSRRALRGEVVRNMNLRAVNFLEQTFDLSASAAPFYEGDRITGAIVVWHDLTDRDRLLWELEAERARLKTIIDNAPEGILVVNEDGRIVMMNPEGERLLAGTIQLGQQISQITSGQILFPDGSAWTPMNFPFAQIMKEGEKIKNREMILNLPQDQHRPLLISAGPILGLSGERQGAIIIFQDLAERKQVEEEARQHAAEIKVHHRLIEQREQERAKIAHYLHEQPLQQLIALTYILSIAESQTEDEKLLETLNSAGNTLRSEIIELRNFCNDLRPPVLANFGLQVAIRSYIEDLIEKYSEINFHMDLDMDRKRIPEMLRLALYRIFQEGITNAIEHAHASSITVSMRLEPASVTISLSDDGCGFEPAEIWKELAGKDRMGLISIQERAEAIGGTFQIHSKPGEGTQIIVQAPLG